MHVNHQMITRVLEEAGKYYGDDPPAEDPMKKYKYNSYEVRDAIKYCRANGWVGTSTNFGRNVEEVGMDRWWIGGLTVSGMDELSSRNYNAKWHNREMIAQRDDNTSLKRSVW